MKTVMYFLIAAVLFVAGCDREPSLTPTDHRATRRAAEDRSKKSFNELPEELQATVWNPSLLEGGYMFEGAQQFDAYVRSAQIVATGVMTEWDGRNGTVRLDSVLHGNLSNKSVPVIATGGFVRPKVGEQVVFLLALRDGELKLHSFCAASGIYKYSDDLARIIKASLK